MASQRRIPRPAAIIIIIIYLHILPRSGMCGAVPPFHIHVRELMLTSNRDNFTFLLFNYHHRNHHFSEWNTIILNSVGNTEEVHLWLTVSLMNQGLGGNDPSLIALIAYSPRYWVVSRNQRLLLAFIRYSFISGNGHGGSPTQTTKSRDLSTVSATCKIVICLVEIRLIESNV